MSKLFIAAFAAAGVAYNVEDPESDEPMVYMDLDCPIGPEGSAQFRLLAYEIAGPQGDRYMRLCINPLSEIDDDEDTGALAVGVGQLNFQLVDARVAFDPEGDLCLICERPLESLTGAGVTQALNHLRTAVGLIYSALRDDVPEAAAEEDSADIPTLAERFQAEYDADLALDYTPDSLERFEPNVDDDYRAFLRSEDLLDANARAYGAYIGEVMVRQGGGRWEPAEALEESTVVLRERSYQPIRMAHAFLESDQALRPSAIVRRALAR